MHANIIFRVVLRDLSEIKHCLNLQECITIKFYHVRYVCLKIFLSLPNCQLVKFLNDDSFRGRIFSQKKDSGFLQH